MITARDIQDRAARQEMQLLVGPQTLLTPSAKDAARELGVKLVKTDTVKEHPDKPAINNLAVAASSPKDNVAAVVEQFCKQAVDGGPDPQLVAMVVKEVLACLGTAASPPLPDIERDSGGLRLVRGNTVTCQPFDTGKPGDKVALADLLPLKESPRMAAGFMAMENTSFDWELRYDEYDYIIEGSLEITINGKTYRGNAGDVFYIPSGSKITFGCPEKVKFFYVTYPANWQDV